jgi:hypothetical protein
MWIRIANHCSFSIHVACDVWRSICRFDEWCQCFGGVQRPSRPRGSALWWSRQGHGEVYPSEQFLKHCSEDIPSQRQSDGIVTPLYQRCAVCPHVMLSLIGCMQFIPMQLPICTPHFRQRRALCACCDASCSRLPFPHFCNTTHRRSNMGFVIMEDRDGGTGGGTRDGCGRKKCSH